MSRSGRPHSGLSPVVAGSQLIATLVLCTAVLAGIGWLVGALVPLVIVGVFVGFAAGLAVVIKRFSDV